jgi:hypothetical protein
LNQKNVLLSILTLLLVVGIYYVWLNKTYSVVGTPIAIERKLQELADRNPNNQGYPARVVEYQEFEEHNLLIALFYHSNKLKSVILKKGLNNKYKIENISLNIRPDQNYTEDRKLLVVTGKNPKMLISKILLDTRESDEIEFTLDVTNDDYFIAVYKFNDDIDGGEEVFSVTYVNEKGEDITSEVY